MSHLLTNIYMKSCPCWLSQMLVLLHLCMLYSPNLSPVGDSNVSKVVTSKNVGLPPQGHLNFNASALHSGSPWPPKATVWFLMLTVRLYSQRNVWKVLSPGALFEGWTSYQRQLLSNNQALVNLTKAFLTLTPPSCISCKTIVLNFCGLFFPTAV